MRCIKITLLCSIIVRGSEVLPVISECDPLHSLTQEEKCRHILIQQRVRCRNRVLQWMSFYRKGQGPTLNSGDMAIQKWLATM